MISNGPTAEKYGSLLFAPCYNPGMSDERKRRWWLWITRFNTPDFQRS